MKLVHAIFEHGVFRPTEPVDLPEGCKVEFEPHLFTPGTGFRSPTLTARWNELKSLQNGWLDGKGVAPDSADIDWLARSFNSHYSDELPEPFVYPTAEGGVQAEWTINGHDLSLEIDLTSHKGQWHCVDLKTGADSFDELDLDNDQGWARLVERVRQLAEGGS
jgi:hypothetical protein